MKTIEIKNENEKFTLIVETINANRKQSDSWEFETKEELQKVIETHTKNLLQKLKECNHIIENVASFVKQKENLEREILEFKNKLENI